MKKLLIALSLLVMTACTGGGAIADCNSDHNKDQLAKPLAGEEIAIMKTNMGEMKIRFFPCDAPEHVTNFKELSKSGFYDGLIFHRVIRGFMNQGGDPLGNGTGGESYKGNGYKLKNEISDNVSHLFGTVAMANAGPDTATSQFYIVNTERGATQLDGSYSVFGQVFEGLDTVTKIGNVETDQCSAFERRLGCDKPLEDVVIESVEITTME